MALNGELKQRLQILESTNREILEKLLFEIESVKYKDELKISLRNSIRESVVQEMKK